MSVARSNGAVVGFILFMCVCVCGFYFLFIFWYVRVLKSRKF
jgi:hypothetical protein